MTDHVFPEDSGTGAEQGDWNDAANFAQLAQASANSDGYVANGLELTSPDYTNNTIDVTAGTALVSDTSATATNTGETRNNVAFVVEADARSGVSLTDSATNYVYLDVDLSTDDSVSVTVNTTGDAPQSPSLLLGTVDTSSNDVTQATHGKDATFGDTTHTSVTTTDTSTVTVNVPSDYSTLQAAIDGIAAEYASRQREVTLNIESGFSPADGVDAAKMNLQHVTIESEDAVVTVDGSFPAETDLFVFEDAHAATIDTVFDMQGLGEYGLRYYQAVGSILPNAGCRNAGRNNLQVSRSFVEAQETEWLGGGDKNVMCTATGAVDLRAATINGATNQGVYLSRASQCHAHDADISGNGGINFNARRSLGTLRNANLDNAGTDALVVKYGSVVNAREASMDNPSSKCIHADASRVNAHSAILSNAPEYGALVQRSATANLQDTTVTGAGMTAIRVDSGSRANAMNANVANYTDYGLDPRDGSIISAHGVNKNGTAIDTSDTTVSSFNAVESRGLIFHA